jgi:molecular chaperone DnaK (HSP70)
MSIRLTVLLVLIVLSACQKQSSPGPAGVTETTLAAPTSTRVTLAKPVGITTAGDVFSPLIPAGQTLPVVHSETFSNQTDGKSEVLVELSQRSAAGIEIITSLRIKIPPAANKALNITVTLSISEAKQMTVKTTVAETASTQQFGPFAVE